MEILACSLDDLLRSAHIPSIQDILDLNDLRIKYLNRSVGEWEYWVLVQLYMISIFHFR